ncbi:hypothetical protein HFE03_07720 [Paenibacillus sp. EKM102P]|uniref:hypothetical protein n=1 Tax=unclassified Paenibacillus TaxID=185978 RepID=UPI00142E67D7|nr:MULTISPECIES: hypothetical protein [unclassified Paenibacillus]KAF6620531.1 hypothetical protein HFE00_05625 [Paenibacillus sp. EKM101P]KAF6623523.1 hypothetical protein HFE03_07720 [Paenibacillus sp. EKM102P]KAF6633913.1 hypothetical protein HFE01_06785 [Paenibacillus sp. EKM10P]KAF6649441.1 hypothetical protein HFE02_01750 [Paenibacillus sp. EKM11P]
MYKKYWNEDGKQYKIKIDEVRVNTSREHGMTYYKLVQKLKIYQKKKYCLGWKCIYINQWDEKRGEDLIKRIRESTNDCFSK